MSITKLHIFNKDTDAVASIRGYEYQKLKTLETWLENGLTRKDELIYCEYEEDIFQRNLNTQTSKFRQIKLYSSVFSFSTEEIQKALSHFFTLFTKADYLFDDVQFVFEASSRIAREQAGNNGQLLYDWAKNQESLPQDILDKCVGVTRKIVTDYFTIQFESTKKAGGLTADIEKGYYQFTNLNDDVWERFVKGIRWKFENLTPEEAVDNQVSLIEDLILKQPRHNVKKEAIKTVLAYLLYQVTQKSTATDPQDRVLDIHLLETCLLEQGSKMDVWYSEIYTGYYPPPTITHFSIGEFYEVLSAAQYCRNHPKLYPHAEAWKNILSQYYSLAGISEYHRKRAVYEMVWLSLKPNYENYSFEGALNSVETELRFFIGTINTIENKDEFEQMMNLLNIIFGLTALESSQFTLKEAIGFIKEYSDRIEVRLGELRDLDAICYLLEFKGLLNISFYYQAKKLSVADSLKPFYELLGLLNTASVFNITQLVYRINEFKARTVQLEDEHNELLVEGLEQILDELRPFLIERSGKFAEAKFFIQRGVPYIYSKKRKSLLNALDFFHKARELYLADETMEGYVLSVLNISQLYNALGLNFAAKYYALTGLWISMNHESGKLLHRIPRAFQFMFVADYTQGAWMNAIASFNYFLIAYQEFPSKEFGDESLTKMIVDMGLMMRVTHEIQPDLNMQFQFLKGSWPKDVADEVTAFEHEWQTELPMSQQVWEIASKRCMDAPYNDLGVQRKLSWNVLGSTWTIVVDNTSDGCALGEEFAAIIQIMLAEISLSETDFHLIKSRVTVYVHCADNYSKPVQQKSNTELIYELSVKKIESKQREDILSHAQLIAYYLLFILGDISLLPMNEIQDNYEVMIRDRSLLFKIFTLNAYHRMASGIYPQTVFDRDQRRNYASPLPGGTFPFVNEVLAWPSGLSAKYIQQEAIQWINNRYDVFERTCGPTIKKHISNLQLSQLVRQYRSEGWLDWQIALALFNYIVSCKVDAKLRGQNFETEDLELEARTKAMREISDMSDDEFRMKFPPEAFTYELLNMHVKILLPTVGKTFGLEIRHSLPNFSAIRELLNRRFNFNIDDVPERSPLKEIK